MGVTFKETVYSENKQPFWRGESKVLPGGYNLKQKFPRGTIIPRGTFVKVNFENLEATIIKHVIVIAGGTTTKPRISKDSLIVVGDKIAKIAGEEVEVKAIDTSNIDYDELTLSKSITTLQEGDILYETTFLPEFVIESTKKVDFDSDITVSISYEAIILKDVIGPIPEDWKEGHYLKNNRNILFINQ